MSINHFVRLTLIKMRLNIIKNEFNIYTQFKLYN